MKQRNRIVGWRARGARRTMFAAVGGAVGGIALVVSCADVDVSFGGAGGASATSGTSGSGMCGTCSISEPITVDKVNNPVAVSIADPVKVAGPVDVNVTNKPLDVNLTNAKALDVNVTNAKVTLDVASLKVVTADSDPVQAQTFSNFKNFTVLATGPFFVTDYYGQFGFGKAADCTNLSGFVQLIPGSGGSAIHGLRVLVPTGYVLCSYSFFDGSYLSGFKPY
jgi:hypothetical protein